MNKGEKYNSHNFSSKINCFYMKLLYNRVVDFAHQLFMIKASGAEYAIHLLTITNIQRKRH